MTLQLHHLDYQGVIRSDGGWRASERHDDLVPLHPSCHESLHRLIERDTVLSRHRSRRDERSVWTSSTPPSPTRRSRDER